MPSRLPPLLASGSIGDCCNQATRYEPICAIPMEPAGDACEAVAVHRKLRGVGLRGNHVAKYSEAAAEAWARSKGASDAEIATARRCLGPETVRTARAPTRPLALGSYGW